ncbi:medium chain dehydrogenase/reductase family protein [Longimicrobium sp.]|uniref:synaptic vesicle VAT-1 family membrane protein n=1 Tax=Longimicrobium sp. TaxID=2029185 RepID=UPI002C58FA55|nr:medium chain dehydrogenase/reductase family protein [Longimicrobium sp.]HSU15298.1 medium chain dehydrogenase/reductase family protein [Longimicrobium sp.]
MRQVWITKRGGPEVLQVREAPDPEPKPGEIRIRVAASGVNFADVMARLGLYPDAPPLPTVMGYEVAGTVDRVGAGVTDFREGDRVGSTTRFGGYSDVVCVPAAQAQRLPDALSFEKAAAIPVNYITAWLMLVTLGNVREGDRVLVHAAAGGVGQAALQICRWKGAEVIGTASASKHARLREMGVAHCIDYRTQDFLAETKRVTGGRGVDIALDAVGGESFRKSYRALAPLGRLYVFGASALATGKRRSLVGAVRGLIAMPAFRPLPMMNSNRGVQGVNLGHLWNEAARLKGIMGEILALVAGGTFDPVVDRTFPFEKAGDAHAWIQDRKNFGKVLLTP